MFGPSKKSKIFGKVFVEKSSMFIVKISLLKTAHLTLIRH